MTQQQHQQNCTWTGAAYSLQVMMDRARYTAENAAKFADRIDASFEGTRGAAKELIEEYERIERHVGFVLDFVIYAAENPSFAENLLSAMRLARGEMELPPMALPAPRRQEARAGTTAPAGASSWREHLRTAARA